MKSPEDELMDELAEILCIQEHQPGDITRKEWADKIHVSYMKAARDLDRLAAEGFLKRVKVLYNGVFCYVYRKAK